MWRGRGVLLGDDSFGFYRECQIFRITTKPSPGGSIPILKEPRRFARLRTHFMLGLCEKYAVTLYELLESVTNRIDPVLDVQMDTLRQWLKVPEGKLRSWDHFNSRALYPA